jgi:hypothetical protein
LSDLLFEQLGLANEIQRPEIEPIRGQMLLFHTGETALLPCPVNEGPRYLVPRRDGHLLVGSTVEEAGFDKSNTPEAIEAVAFILFVPSAVLTLLSALSFLVLRRRGWLLAAIGQGLGLAVCLWLYSRFQPWYVYPIMAYCTLMILYLNSHDVRVVFRRKRDAGERGLGEAA